MPQTLDNPEKRLEGDVDPGKAWRREQNSRLVMLRSQLDVEFSSFRTTLLDLAYHFAPYAERFLITDTNQGRKKNFMITKGTGMRAARTLRAGMMASMTSPERPWYEIGPADPGLLEDKSCKNWFWDVTERTRNQFLKTNFYESMPRLYGDGSIFATSVIWQEEDFERVGRYFNLPTGSYKIALNEHGECDTVMRDLRMTVRQVVEMFARDRRTGKIDWSKVSTGCKKLWENDMQELWLEVAHWVVPNLEYDPRAWGVKGMRYLSFWKEAGGAHLGTEGSNMYGTESVPYDQFLRVRGYQHFPALVFIWEKTGSDSYGTSSPGWDSIGDNRELQLLRRRQAQAVDKQLNPPLLATYDVKQGKHSMLPGEFTYVKSIGPDSGIKPVYEVKFDLQSAQLMLQDLVQDINEFFYVDLWRAVLDDPRRIPATAEEIKERKGEGYLLLGPTFQNLNRGVLDPAVMFMFNTMMAQGKLPPAPKKLMNSGIKVTYTSIMAKAMQLMNVSAMQSFLGFLTSASQVQPTPAMDGVNMDQFIREYGKSLGISPRILRSDDEVGQIRDQRGKVQAAQAQQQQMAEHAEVAKNLAAASPQADNMLGQLMQRAQLGNPLPTR